LGTPGGAMNKSEIGELSLKILSIYTFIHALGALQFPIAMFQPAMRTQGSVLYSIGSFIPATLLLVFSGFLWLGAGQLESTSDAVPESSGEN
jgi:hypothetical protein